MPPGVTHPRGEFGAQTAPGDTPPGSIRCSRHAGTHAAAPTRSWHAVARLSPAPAHAWPGLGGDKDTVPLHTPTAEEAGQGVLGAGWGGATGTPPYPAPPHPVPAPPSCPQPSCLCRGGGGAGGGRELLPARWMGGIKPDLVSLSVAKPRALAALQPGERRAGGGGAQHHPLSRASRCPPPSRNVHPPPFLPLLPSPGSLGSGGGDTGSLSPTGNSGAA